MTEVKIVEIQAVDPTAAPVKIRHFNQDIKYAIPVKYVLEDGRVIDGTETYRLQRDAKADLATLPHAPKYPTAASFDNDGKFFGTVQKFSIGARGLVAEEVGAW